MAYHAGTGTPPTVKDEGIQIIFHFKFEPDFLFPFLCKLYIFLYLRLLVPYLRVVASNKRLNIQRRLAWSLCKDDTHDRREAKPFFVFLPPCTIVWMTQLHL